MDTGSNLTRELRRLADGLSHLLRQHVDLARIELRQDARQLAADAALGAVAVPFLLVAQILVSVALALWIAEALGGPWAFAIVGAANGLLGAALAIAGVTRARRRTPGLGATAEELRKDRRILGELQDGGATEIELPPPGEVRVVGATVRER